MKGFFITFEGIEGSGKSTQARMLADALILREIPTVLTFEPGGTKIGERIREILLAVEHDKMDSITELLLYNASRCQHVREIIVPSLKRNNVVISDRFIDSTLAYQGSGRGIPFKTVENVNKIAVQGLKPDITILLDIPVESSLERTGQYPFLWSLDLKRSVRSRNADRIELETLEFHRKVRQSYLKLKEREPHRILDFDATLPIENLHEKILDAVLEKMKVYQGSDNGRGSKFKSLLPGLKEK